MLTYEQWSVMCIEMIKYISVWNISCCRICHTWLGVSICWNQCETMLFINSYDILINSDWNVSFASAILYIYIYICIICALLISYYYNSMSSLCDVKCSMLAVMIYTKRINSILFIYLLKNEKLVVSTCCCKFFWIYTPKCIQIQYTWI